MIRLEGVIESMKPAKTVCSGFPDDWLAVKITSSFVTYEIFVEPKAYAPLYRSLGINEVRNLQGLEITFVYDSECEPMNILPKKKNTELYDQVLIPDVTISELKSGKSQRKVVKDGEPANGSSPPPYKPTQQLLRNGVDPVWGPGHSTESTDLYRKNVINTHILRKSGPKWGI